MNGPVERRAQVERILELLEPGAAERVTSSLDALHPDIVPVILGHAFDDVVSRPGIDLRTREMLTVAMLAAMGTAPGQLEFHCRAALNVGVTREELVEIMLQVSVYAGVPACMNGLAAARAAFEAAASTAPA